MHIACCTIVQFVVVCCHRQSCALLFFWAYINLTPSAISIRSMAPGTRRNDQLKCVQRKLFLQCSRADFPQEYSKHDIAMKKKRVENTSDCMTFARHEISHFEVSGATIFLGKIILHGRFINFKPKFQALTLLIFAERNQRYPLGLYLFGESKTIQWKTINIHSVYLLFAVSPGSHFWADIKTHEKQTSERKINWTSTEIEQQKIEWKTIKKKAPQKAGIHTVTLQQSRATWININTDILKINL